jgi:hypothetical protein
VTSLRTIGKAHNERVNRCGGSKDCHDVTLPSAPWESFLKLGVKDRHTETRQHQEKPIGEALVLILHVPTGIVIAVVPREGLKEGGETESYDKQVEPDALLAWESPEEEKSEQGKD